MSVEQTLPISSLYPHETGVIADRVDYFVKEINSGHGIDAISVAQVSDCWIVCDGHNRVAAAKECGWTEVPVVLGLPFELRAYKDSLASAQKRGRLGFENLERDTSESERIARAKQELYEDYRIIL